VSITGITGRWLFARARFRAWLLHRFERGVFIPDGTIHRGARLLITMGGRFAAAPGCVLAENATIHAEIGVIEVGQNAFFGIGSVVVARELIIIGDDVLIAEHVTIRDQNHVFGGRQPTAQSGFSTAPVRIGNNVWIGAKCTITKGVTIGENTVIGANSVVTGNIPANVVAAGAPARVLRPVANPVFDQ
jgi:acetyltransferase-like isoleucine patch superfamily enzyme